MREIFRNRWLSWSIILVLFYLYQLREEVILPIIDEARNQSTTSAEKIQNRPHLYEIKQKWKQKSIDDAYYKERSVDSEISRFARKQNLFDLKVSLSSGRKEAGNFKHDGVHISAKGKYEDMLQFIKELPARFSFFDMTEVSLFRPEGDPYAPVMLNMRGEIYVSH